MANPRLIVLTVVFLFGCRNISPNEASGIKKDSFTLVGDTVIFSGLGQMDDSVKIVLENRDTLTYDKISFKVAQKYFANLNKGFVVDPDVAYAMNVIIEYADSVGSRHKISYGSETGQDSYYMLYAYFLRKENWNTNLDQRRHDLIEIYRLINELFQDLNYGGTYFGHQYRRILGCAEYAIYQDSKGKEFYERKYNMSAQKQLYLNSLKQYIDDELSVDANIIGKSEKEKRRSELYQLVDQLDTLIVDYFYLKEAQEFQSSYY